MNSSVETEQERGVWVAGVVRSSTSRNVSDTKRRRLASPPDGRSRMGAALRVLCAQLCQRSPGRGGGGQIVEEVVASGSESKGEGAGGGVGGRGTKRGVTERWFGRG